jgi:hypothetical protein
VLLVDADVDPEAWEERRQALVAGEVTFSELLHAAGLRVRAAALAPWRHWITPEVEDRRYDTRFLMAALPAGQQARDLGGEADRVRWVTPRAALNEYAGGRLPMLPPTVDVLRSLLPFGTPEQALASAPDRPIRPLMPHPLTGAGGQVRWALIDAATRDVLLDLDDGPAGSEFHGINP